MAVEAQFGSANYAQDMMTSAGDGFNNATFCFNPQLQIAPHHNSLPFVGLAQIVDSLAQKQQHEIDQYIIDQYEGLRLNLQDLRKRDLSSIINRIETKSRDILIQKDQEIARAKNRTAQLELILHKAETEHQQWQHLALNKEAQVAHLSNTLQQMLNPVFVKNDVNGGDDDAESCCDVEKNRASGMCKGCGEREACVVLLPCRHLCCCVVCEVGIGSCLVCGCLKQNAIQVLTL